MGQHFWLYGVQRGSLQAFYFAMLATSNQKRGDAVSPKVSSELRVDHFCP